MPLHALVYFDPKKVQFKAIIDNENSKPNQIYGVLAQSTQKLKYSRFM